MTNNTYEIYYDAFQEGKWFQCLSKHLSDAILLPISQTDNPEVRKLLRYDKPDIILLHNGKAVISLEKTTEVPTGHNIGQRFGRIVCAAEEKVIGIYFGPFLAMKHGTYAGKCWLNVRQLRAMLKLKEFHHIPSLAVNWKCDSKYELIRNGTETDGLSSLVNRLIEHNFSPNITGVSLVEQEMGEVIDESETRRSAYKEPPPSARIISTDKYKQDKRLNGVQLPKYFFSRAKSLHYVVGMKAGLRSDPFTGMQLVYDYAYCRTGPNKEDRSINLVMEIPDLSVKDWDSVTNTERKDKRMLKLFPDLLLLKDGVV
ncbi:MAG: hypothetical protein PHH14_00660 [Candidatus Margulisbacteria bacterium]|nr:hypothetical protein [Candidatus Margulisiibacteriota bacterium]